MQLNSMDQFPPQGRTNIQVNGDKPQIKNPTKRTRVAAHGELWLWAPGGLEGFVQPCEERPLGSSSLEWRLASGLLPDLSLWASFFTFHPYLAFISSEKDEPGYKGDETRFSF